MSFCVLFGLLFCCLAYFREGVWTPYTPQDVARWHTQAAVARDAFSAQIKAGHSGRASVGGRAAVASPEARTVCAAEMVG